MIHYAVGFDSNTPTLYSPPWNSINSITFYEPLGSQGKHKLFYFLHANIDLMCRERVDRRYLLWICWPLLVVLRASMSDEDLLVDLSLRYYEYWFDLWHFCSKLARNLNESKVKAGRGWMEMAEEITNFEACSESSLAVQQSMEKCLWWWQWRDWRGRQLHLPTVIFTKYFDKKFCSRQVKDLIFTSSEMKSRKMVRRDFLWKWKYVETYRPIIVRSKIRTVRYAS